jgi:hypothetical protein
MVGKMANSETNNAGVFDGYIDEEEMAKQRDVSVRTLQLERQRGDGPPWVKVGRDVYYPIDGFRDWLKSIERRPVRSSKVGAKRASQLEAL